MDDGDRGIPSSPSPSPAQPSWGGPSVPVCADPGSLEQQPGFPPVQPPVSGVGCSDGLPSLHSLCLFKTQVLETEV